MKRATTMAGFLVAAVTTMASADALALLAQEDASDTPPPSEAVVASPWYVSAAVGGNIALDAKVKDSGAKFKFKTGFGVNVGVGYLICEQVAVEIRSGVLWNRIKDVEGGFEGGTLGGGSGHIYQVPVMANVVYTVPLNEQTNLGIKAGAGMQWTDLDADSITFMQGGVTTGGYAFKHNAVAFRWEVGLQLATRIADNVRIGGGVIFGGTSEVDIGSMSGPMPGSRDEKLKGLCNVSLGFGVNIAF